MVAHPSAPRDGAGQASGYRPSASIPYDRAVTDHDRTIPLRYSTPAMLGHWLVVLLIVSTYCVEWTMVSLRISPTQLRLFNYQKWIGVTIFVIAVVHVLWGLWLPPPPLSTHMHPWEQEVRENKQQ